MEPTDEFIDLLDRDDIEQARRMTPSQKLRAGGDIFDEMCRWMTAGIRADYPELDEAGVRQELRRRIALAEVD